MNANQVMLLCTLLCGEGAAALVHAETASVCYITVRYFPGEEESPTFSNTRLSCHVEKIFSW